MLFKEISSIEDKDIDFLVKNSVSEGKTIEFKSKKPGGNDKEKREFLADVSSFANTEGGHLIFGVEENEGIAILCPGVVIENRDNLILRNESLINDGIQPRIPGIKSRVISISNGKYIYIIYIPKSWLSPHMVIYKNLSRFYKRNSAGKYQLDVNEIKDSVLESHSLESKITDFRNERISKILSLDTPIPFKLIHNIVLHFIPIESFQSNINIDFTKDPNENIKLITTHEFANYQRLNINGMVNCLQYKTGEFVNYNQYFRNGIVEIVDGDTLSKNQDGEIIPDIVFEVNIIRALRRVMDFYKNIQINPPIYLFMSLLNVRGFTMAKSRYARHLSDTEIRRLGVDLDLVFLPEVIINNFKKDKPTEFMKSTFDLVWNSTGLPRSANYDTAGIWKLSSNLNQ